MSNTKQTKYSSLGIWLSVAILHLCLTAFMTWPVILQINEGVFGGPRGDKWVYIWNFWWFKYSLLQLHQLPLFTGMQYYPTGTSLALHDMNYLWSLLSIPLQSFLSLGTILNLFMLSCFLLNGLSFFICAHKITKSTIGSFVGSVLFTYCPYFLGRFTVSHIGLLSAFFIPPFFLMLWRYHEEKEGKHLALASLFIALTTLCHFYYGTILLVLFLFFTGYQLATKDKSSIAPPRIKHFIWSFLIIAISLAPLTIPIITQLAQGDYESYSEQGYKSLEGNSADLMGYIVPDYTIAEWRGYDLTQKWRLFANSLRNSLSGNPYEKAVYPGLTSWLFLLIGCLIPEIRKRFWPWLLLALFSFIWTLGPTLYIKGQPYLEGMLPIRFLNALPILKFLRTPTRFAFFIPLSAGILLAATLAHLGKRSLLLSRTTALIVLGWIVLEFIPTPQVLIPKQIFISSFYNMIRQDPAQYGILNIPADFYGARGGGDIFQYAQTIHQKPIVGGYIARTPTYVSKTRDNSPFIQAVEQHEYDQDQRLRLSPEGFSDMRGTLKSLNLRYVVVHRPLISGNEWPNVSYWLEKGLGPPIFQDEWIEVYNGYHQ
ncbi:MAG: hypothetical protein PHI06_07335 [Desulfobulbaceae bacterium]|nr:hypothetical protein [Desulfobulbaceae bacterium]